MSRSATRTVEVTPPAERAFLVALEPPAAERWPVERRLAELGALAAAAGAEVVGSASQKRAHPDPSWYFGKGRAADLADEKQMTGFTLLVVDDELSPAQQRNLEKLIDGKVVDRSALILDIFARHARTKEGRLQVELAQLEYHLPRLTRMWTHLSRTGGGIGTRGPGESQLETDRRLIREKIKKVRADLAEVKRQRATAARNRDRHEVATVALVGYTNAGKSTLLNKLTGSNVFVEDKLFATLDTRTRRWQLPGWGPVLLSDTVGFIRDLPHGLIASFKATLEEARQADLLLHVVDASNPAALEQIAAVYQVLEELGIREKDTILVLNQVDAIDQIGALEILKQRYPLAVPISARTGEGLARLAAAVSDALSQDFQDVDIETGVANGRLLAYLAQHGEILSRTYTEDRVSIHCRMPRKFLGQIPPQEAVIRSRSNGSANGNGNSGTSGNGAPTGHAATNGHASNGSNGNPPANDLVHIDLSEFDGNSAK
jgi:GTPase